MWFGSRPVPNIAARYCKSLLRYLSQHLYEWRPMLLGHMDYQQLSRVEQYTRFPYRSTP